ncbi:hypothetical protein L6164_006047 [Bauhinia variegata]|uniref:Uncharacterized protein n=1 Tax=Bauhinia variegata TaxID=167791 RepID=A0ACB9PTQ2_BAUVA|nr:hypothetical protein L6164_006047 [Bauhinia variegata]
MASMTTATWSPSSLQLRLAMNYGNCRKFPVIVQSRMRKLNRGVRVLCVGQSGAGSGSGLERPPNGGTWVGSDSKIDGFSGWSNSEGAENSQEKKSNGGVVGAGVAGVLLLAGFTFAAISVNKRISSRSKQQMEPLTAQQEVLLSSDDHNDKVSEHVNSDNKIGQEDGTLEGLIGVSEDSPPEFDKIRNDHNIDEDSEIGSQLIYNSQHTSNGTDAASNISTQEELKRESDFDNKLAVSYESSRPFNPSESGNAADSFNASGFRDFDSNPAVTKAESTTGLKENTSTIEPEEVSNDDANPLHLNTEEHDEITRSNSGRSSSPPVTSSSTVAEVPNNTVIDNGTVNLKSSTISDPEYFPQNDLGNSPASAKENHDVSKMARVSAEENKSSLEEQQFSENDLSGKASVLVSPNAYANEQDRNSHDEINRSIPESSNSGVFFSAPGIPAPSIVSAAIEVLPGKVLVPAAIDQVQGQALAALQVLKVIEHDVQPGDLCTRREFARWLVSASSALSRNTISKVYPAMYIENVTELAFDDVTPEDPDFSSIQGLAEAGLIESKLSRRDIQFPVDEDSGPFYFSPESPLSRQNLVTWKMALEKRQLPHADRKTLYQLSGFIDTDTIHPDACPALVADLSAGEQGIIALAFGYTRLFQPDKPVTKAQAAVALATGDASDIVSEELARIEAESMAENAVAAHSALVAQVEKDINASYEQELYIEKEKINAVERMAEEARRELERLRAEREEDNIALVKERAAIESEMEVFSRLRREVEDQLQSLLNNKVEISYEKERISKLREQAEVENKEIARLQYELEVERKALSMARAWAEDEAKRVREQAKALEEARDRWERHGIKVVVDDDLREEASTGVTWLNAGQQISVQETVNRAENLIDKLKKLRADIRGKSRSVIDKIMHTVSLFISNLKEWASKTGKQAEELKETAISNAGKSAKELQQSAFEFGLSVKEGAKRIAGDCKEGVDKLTQRFKTSHSRSGSM